MRSHVFLVRVLTLLTVASSAAAATASAPAPDRAREAVVKALASGGDIPGQAHQLAELAWPPGKRDEVVSARARQELENFGDHAMTALRDALNTVKIAYTDEVVSTALGAQQAARTEMGSSHLPIILDALWVGSHDAKVRAIQAIAITHSPVAVQPMIDSAIADPTLAPLVVETLGALRYPQARFYLDKMMMEGPAPIRPAAASSLSQIGGAALAPLKNALKAPNRDARILAARALLPSATEYELGALYEYLEKHGDDDDALTQSLKASAANIEKAIAARDANAAAASPKNF